MKNVSRLYREKLTGIPNSVLWSKVLEDDAFIKQLVDKLMLDELLRGEADSVEFFKEMVDEVIVDNSIAYHKRYIKILEGE